MVFIFQFTVYKKALKNSLGKKKQYTNLTWDGEIGYLLFSSRCYSKQHWLENTLKTIINVFCADTSMDNNLANR